ncbi:MAG: S4 domain-containing protein, partial [Gammaproteobacteria bacterium]
MSDDVRLDKWLWAARFFKTRALAREAVTGGKVHLNGQRAKPSRNVKIGDSIDISRGHFRYEITVDAVSDRRGAAREAAKLFTESEESVEKRTAIAQELALRRRVAPIPPASRPD